MDLLDTNVVSELRKVRAGKWIRHLVQPRFRDSNHWQFSIRRKTLSSPGFTISSGLLGAWTMNCTGDTIQAYLGAPDTPAPGPLPLLGAGAAFGWSRLRKRIATPLITPPQA